MTQSIKNLLGSTPELRGILQTSTQLLTLQRQFAAVAPSYLAQHAQVAGLKLGVLTLVCANATVAAKLRHLAPEISKSLRHRGCEVSGIHAKVQVAYAHPRPVARTRTLAQPARQALQHLSADLPDSPLKTALEHLLQTKSSPR